jgi:alpha-N-acetylglucosaminidase
MSLKGFSILRKMNRSSYTFVFFRLASLQLLELFDDLEEILSSCKDFLLGVWLNDAKMLAPKGDKQIQENYEFNARNQITLWGPTGEIVDYANKQWSGVVQDYFRPRWAIFLKELENTMKNHSELNERRIRQIIFNEVELPFSYSKKLYPTEAKGAYIYQSFLIIINLFMLLSMCCLCFRAFFN